MSPKGLSFFGAQYSYAAAGDTDDEDGEEFTLCPGNQAPAELRGVPEQLIQDGIERQESWDDEEDEEEPVASNRKKLTWAAENDGQGYEQGADQVV